MYKRRSPNKVSRALYEPTTVRVKVRQGIPARVGSVRVESLREEWLVEDGWWTPKPTRRHYFELVLTNGHNTVIFYDLINNSWFSQIGA